VRCMTSTVTPLPPVSTRMLPTSVSIVSVPPVATLNVRWVGVSTAKAADAINTSATNTIRLRVIDFSFVGLYAWGRERLGSPLSVVRGGGKGEGQRENGDRVTSRRDGH